MEQVITYGSSLEAQLASLPRYDPLAPTKRGNSRLLAAISIALHLGLLFFFWNTLFGSFVEEEEVVVVRMIDERQPEPEPPKLRRKVLAQRRVDASVRRFKEINQPDVVEVKPVSVLDQVRRVQVERTKLTEAPKSVEQRTVATKAVSAFARTPARVQPAQVSDVSGKVTQVTAARASAGPRKLVAAGPVTNARAADINAPVVRRGVISQNAIEGDVEGARVADIESGTSRRAFEGGGDRGLLGGVEKSCETDPVCLAYLEMIEERVYSRWLIPQSVGGGQVRLRFRIDRGGSAHSLSVASASDTGLGETCVKAFRHASPFPPPPREILYIVNKPILASFHTTRVQAN